MLERVDGRGPVLCYGPVNDGRYATGRALALLSCGPGRARPRKALRGVPPRNYRGRWTGASIPTYEFFEAGLMVLILSLTRRANAWRAGLEGGRASAWAFLWGQGSRHPPTIQYWGHGIWPSGAHRMMSGPNNLIAAALLGARRPP